MPYHTAVNIRFS